MYKNVKQWRHNTKQKLVEGFGGRCAICGLQDHPSVYDFHHRDPTVKDFILTGKIRKWDVMIEEAKKCALLCCICHRKLHMGLCVLPDTVAEFVDKGKPEPPTSPCPVCGTLKSVNQVTCSVACNAKSREKLDWDAAVDYYKHCNSMIAVARKFGCSDKAVKKQLRKRGIL